jgi:hypothetical protein
MAEVLHRLAGTLDARTSVNGHRDGRLSSLAQRANSAGSGPRCGSSSGPSDRVH